MRTIWNILFFGGRSTQVILSVALLLFFAKIAHIQAETNQNLPHIFFSDIVSGPATGGESDQGAFVTLYGTNFGSTRNNSFVTVGGAPVVSYPVWNDNKISFQLGHSARSGDIIVHRNAQSVSNGIPFLIRSGHIFFFPAKNSDSLQHLLSKLHPGDILYLHNGTEVSSLDRYDAVLNFMNSGRVDNPISLIAYPGASATIGSIDGPRISIRTPNVSRTSDHWVIAGLHIRGNQEAFDLTYSKDWRVIGNDFTCPHGFGPTGCVEVSQSSDIAFLGNNIHDVAMPGTTKVYHGLYFSTDSNHIDVGWNTISNVQGCRAIQFHSTPTDRGTGRNQYDLHVHDNIIHDVVCDGINFATVDPSKGTVEAYNNLFYNVGIGPDPPDGSSNYACIYVQGGANYGGPGSGTVEIYNNTFYRCGERRNTDAGAFAFSKGSPNQQVRLRNNLVVLDSGTPLLSPNSTAAPLQAESNLVWWTSGRAPQRVPSGFTVANPQLRDPAREDFRLMPGSPAVGSGIDLHLSWNLSGEERRRLDIGAY